MAKKKITELIRKRGGKLVDLEGRTIAAEPIDKEVCYRCFPDSLDEPYNHWVAHKHFQGITIRFAPTYNADAYVLRGDPKWRSEGSGFYWEQKVQYYKIQGN